MPHIVVIPAKAGIQGNERDPWPWIPAFAGMTNEVVAAGPGKCGHHAFFRGGSRNMRLRAQQRTMLRSIFDSLGYQISIHI
jgi:hypothetical protein